MATIAKVWSISERILKENRTKGIYLFDVLVESIIICRADIWGWKKKRV